MQINLPWLLIRTWIYLPWVIIKQNRTTMAWKAIFKGDWWMQATMPVLLGSRSWKIHSLCDWGNRYSLMTALATSEEPKLQEVTNTKTRTRTETNQETYFVQPQTSIKPFNLELASVNVTRASSQRPSFNHFHKLMPLKKNSCIWSQHQLKWIRSNKSWFKAINMNLWANNYNHLQEYTRYQILSQLRSKFQNWLELYHNQQ